MTYAKNKSYCDIPFSLETPRADFYTYWSLHELTKKSNGCKEHVFNCRTIGILQSKDGKFFLTDLESPNQELHVRVSMVYLTAPPQSTVVPYPVQVFGALHWKNRPVIFANILQVLNISTAIKLQKAMSAVTSLHLANETRLYCPGPAMLDEGSIRDEKHDETDESIQNSQMADLSVTLLTGAFPR